MAQKETPAVTNFREYLRINTSQPRPDYESAVRFLSGLGEELQLCITVIQITATCPMLLMTWPGSCPTLPSLLLTSHMDVVPVFAEHWKVDPFSAEKFDNGDIYARGSQDMKSVGIQYLEAIRQLKCQGYKPLRTIHTLFTPDEEIGSLNGMASFVTMEEFKNMNVGCVLDEGLASPSDQFVIYNGQKVNYAVEVKCEGQPGHGSQLIEGTAGEKMRTVIDKFMDLRESEKTKAAASGGSLSDIIVCNLTQLSGGVQNNVVPDQLGAWFDLRVPPTFSKHQMESIINDACSAPGVSWKYFNKPVPVSLTSVDPSDPWWAAFSSALQHMKLDYRIEVFPAGTDSRYITPLKIHTYGFSPMNQTPILLHDHNEYLNEGVFLRGIPIYVEIIARMAGVAEF